MILFSDASRVAWIHATLSRVTSLRSATLRFVGEPLRGCKPVALGLFVGICLALPLLLPAQGPAPGAEKIVSAEQAAFNKADDLYAKKLWSEADKAFVKFRQQYPKHALRFNALLRIGQIQRQTGAPLKAVATLKSLVNDPLAKTEAPDITAAAYEQLHTIHLNQKLKPADRRALVTHAGVNLPNYQQIRRLFGLEIRLMLVENEKPAAIAAFAKTAPPNLPDPWNRVARAFLEPEQPADALAPSPHLLLIEAVRRQSAPAAENLCRMLNNPPGLSLSLLQNTLLATDTKDAVAVSRAYAALRKTWPAQSDVIDLHHGGVLIEVLQNYPQANAHCEAFLKTYPDSPLRESAHYRWIQLALQRNEHAAAIARIDSFLEAFPNSRMKKNLEDERLKSQQALERDQARERAREERKAQTAALDDTTKARMEADKLLRAGKFSEAGKLYAQVLKNPAHPEWSAAQYGAGLCLRGLKRHADAVSAFENALRRAPMMKEELLSRELLAKIHFARAEVLLEDLARPSDAFDGFKAALAAREDARPPMPELDWNLALSAVACGERAYAFELLSLMKDNPKNTPLHNQRIARLLLLCDPQSPLPANHFVLRSFTTGGQQFRTAETLYISEKWAPAQIHFEALARQFSTHELGDFASLRVGQCLANQGLHKEAGAGLQNFAQRRPHSLFAPDALLLCAVISVGPLERPEAGAKFLDAIIQRYPLTDSAQTALLYLATLAYWDKSWARAEQLHRAYLSKYPESPNNDFIRDHRLPQIAARGR